MSEELKQQLIQITNQSKPSLGEIESHIFEATQRFLDARKMYNSTYELVPNSEQIAGFAANIKLDDSKFINKSYTNKFRICSLCESMNSGTVDHPFSKCLKFLNAKDKVDKIKLLNGCIKCGYLNHKTDQCKFKFYRRCDRCDGRHFSFLCSANRRSETVSMPISDEISLRDSVINTSINFSDTVLSNETLLPTFTVVVDDEYKLRSLKDTGSQSNFILSSVAEKFGFKVIQYLDITINGFNSTADYRTKVVEFSARFGDKNHIIQAICVPSINTTIRINGLKEIVEAITKKRLHFS